MHVHKNEKCGFRLECADSAGRCETTIYTNVRMSLFACCKPFVKGGYLTLCQTSPGFNVSAVKPFENTVRKGEIARNEQFLLFPQRFLLF